MAAAIRGSDARSGLARTGTLISTCGNISRSCRRSARSRPVSLITLMTDSAVSSPSPVGSNSEKIRCPDCSPPSTAPCATIASRTWRSPTGQRCTATPAARRPISSPTLLITVATTALPGSLPQSFRKRAQMNNIASPSTTSPWWSTRITRSPSPSNASPMRQSWSVTARCRPSGCVDPQSRLMFRPSGSTFNATTSKPSWRSTSGAARDIAPLAQSAAMRSRGRAAQSASTPAACARYAPERSCGSGAAQSHTGTSHDSSITNVSISASRAGDALPPSPVSTLIPLSGNGL